MSPLNPYSNFIDAAHAAVTAPGDASDRLTLAAKEFFGPLFGEQLFTGAVMDAARNKKENGAEVYSEADDAHVQWAKKLGHVFATFVPGTAERFVNKILPALRGEETTYGDALNPEKEITKELTGVNRGTYNYESGTRLQAAKFNQEGREIVSQFLKTVSRPGRVDSADILASYDQMEDRRFKKWKDMRAAVKAAEKSGLNQQAVYTNLTAGGLGDDEVASLMSGIYAPYDVTSEAVLAAYQKYPGRVPIYDLADRYQKRAAAGQGGAK